MPSNADKLRHIIKHAVDNGWTPEGHNGEVLTSTSPKPDLLRYKAEILVTNEGFLGLLAMKAFLQAIFGDDWEQQLIELVKTESAQQQLERIYLHALGKENSNF